MISVVDAITGIGMFAGGWNLYTLFRFSGKILGYDSEKRRADQTEELSAKLFSDLADAQNQVMTLADKVDQLSAPERPFIYIHRRYGPLPETQAIADWLDDKDPALFALELDHDFAPRGQVSYLKFATEDKNLAMLFKLTWGGVQ